MKSDFQNALQIEFELPQNNGDKRSSSTEHTILSLFGAGQDKIGFEEFRAWIIYNKEATVLSKW